MERRDQVILQKMLSEITVAQNLLGGSSLETFQENEMQKRAVCMTVINIGELVKNLSADCKASDHTIPWRAIAGFRDIAAHKYQTLRMEDVFETVTSDFPALADKLRALLIA